MDPPSRCANRRHCCRRHRRHRRHQSRRAATSLRRRHYPSPAKHPPQRPPLPRALPVPHPGCRAPLHSALSTRYRAPTHRVRSTAPLPVAPANRTSWSTAALSARGISSSAGPPAPLAALAALSPVSARPRSPWAGGWRAPPSPSHSTTRALKYVALATATATTPFLECTALMPGRYCYTAHVPNGDTVHPQNRRLAS